LIVLEITQQQHDDVSQRMLFRDLLGISTVQWYVRFLLLFSVLPCIHSRFFDPNLPCHSNSFFPVGNSINAFMDSISSTFDQDKQHAHYHSLEYGEQCQCIGTSDEAPE